MRNFEVGGKKERESLIVVGQHLWRATALNKGRLLKLRGKKEAANLNSPWMTAGIGEESQAKLGSQ